MSSSRIFIPPMVFIPPLVRAECPASDAVIIFTVVVMTMGHSARTLSVTKLPPQARFPALDASQIQF
jgi:hypothetical protein